VSRNGISGSPLYSGVIDIGHSTYRGARRSDAAAAVMSAAKTRSQARFVPAGMREPE